MAQRLLPAEQCGWDRSYGWPLAFLGMQERKVFGDL